ncbi:hypothetical protein [Oricola cellulosilytica]|uniref:DUF680 domain-containing protein n=1 Tax=Oricola cellulosilytica TaxID=1429082 RepID=A0A4R0PC47_9HYPH|nr:hypothetical protein [Oricola cellulosilytica]TCD15031.1 hypothetical protein E0D97_05640 [Oricola cellulosilytica]
MVSPKMLLPVPATLLALATAFVSALPAAAHDTSKSEEDLIDRRSTGSIATTDPDICNRATARLGTLCDFGDGEPAQRFPSVPINPSFGI